MMEKEKRNGNHPASSGQLRGNRDTTKENKKNGDNPGKKGHQKGKARKSSQAEGLSGQREQPRGAGKLIPH